MNKRRDKKGRILHYGEYQMPDGRYRFRYTSWDGQRKTIYSWRLAKNDKAPEGRKYTESLREMEKKIHAVCVPELDPVVGQLPITVIMRTGPEKDHILLRLT